MKVRYAGLVSAVAAVGLYLWSCSDQKPSLSPISPAEKGAFAFNCGTVASLAKALAIDSNRIREVNCAVVTIADSFNTVIQQEARINLYNNGYQFVSSPLTLQAGAFKITQFALISRFNEILFATPLQNTSAARFVNRPLPVGFSVYPNDTTTLTMQVIPFDSANPRMFGFLKFIVDIRDTVDTGNVPPSAAVYSPQPGQYFKPRDSVPVYVWASDTDGTISKVMIYRDSMLVASDSGAGHHYVVLRNLPLGQHSVYAVAFDNKNARTESQHIPFTVSNTTPNIPPFVGITSPAWGQYFKPRDSIYVNAYAYDSDGTIAKVVFFRDSVQFAVDSVAPYSKVLRNLARGQHSVNAVAYDNKNAQTESGRVYFMVSDSLPNEPPSVYMTSPFSGQYFKPSDSIPVVAEASDSDGTIARVEFYRDSMLVGTDSTYPYRIVLRNQTLGYHIVYAVAYDNRGASTMAYGVGFDVSTIGPNTPPVARITSPANNATFNAVNSIPFTVAASDSDGTVAKVLMYRDSVLIGTDSIAPYTMTMRNVPAGQHMLTARAVDNLAAEGWATSVIFTVR